MAADRTSSGTPDAELPELTGALEPPTPEESRDLLGVELMSVVDEVRAIPAELGLRPYRVWMVHVEWTGKTRGQGEAHILSRREILPVPRVREDTTPRLVVSGVGRTESGALIVDRVSAKYTEDDLMGRTPDLQDPALPRTSRRNVEFFYEVQEVRPSSPTPALRRYALVGVPVRKPVGGWRLVLERQSGERNRSGGFNQGGL